ncbi:MAG: N-acetyltransferase [Synechococcales bacterium]|nr:N-acetyltransferase [Synechococcales bacterium]
MVQPKETVVFGPMSLERHQPEEVAALIYESAPELFALIFGPQAIALLTHFVGRSHNRYSHQYVRVAAIGHRVVGMASFVPAARVTDEADYRDVLSFGQRLWLKWVRYLLLRHILQHSYPAGSFYIGSLAVAAEHRNQGIGRQLLAHCIAEAKPTASPVFISVDIENGRAQKLYESLGFQVIETKTLRLPGRVIGSRVLTLIDC